MPAPRAEDVVDEPGHRHPRAGQPHGGQPEQPVGQDEVGRPGGAAQRRSGAHPPQQQDQQGDRLRPAGQLELGDADGRDARGGQVLGERAVRHAAAHLPAALDRGDEQAPQDALGSGVQPGVGQREEPGHRTLRTRSPAAAAAPRRRPAVRRPVGTAVTVATSWARSVQPSL